MSSFVLIQVGAPVLAALAGGAAGWWLRGRPTAKCAKQPRSSAKASRRPSAAKSSGGGRNSSVVRRTTRRLHSRIKSELDEATSTEPIIITKLADSIVESTDLVQHQCNDIRKSIHTKRQEIRNCLANSDRLLFTFASLDRQEQAYRQVLSSLEVLAAELSSEIKGHGQATANELAAVSKDPRKTPSAGVAGAVTQILDATADVEQRVAKTEQRIAAQAENVEMQAILTHADLLTSLPNRRALVAELAASRFEASQTPKATLIFIDLDSFSLVNSEYGHQGGDMILRQAAAEIKKLARGRDMVARFRGDTFALLLNQTTLARCTAASPRRVRKQLQDTQFTQGTNPLRSHGEHRNRTIAARKRCCEARRIASSRRSLRRSKPAETSVIGTTAKPAFRCRRPFKRNPGRRRGIVIARRVIGTIRRTKHQIPQRLKQCPSR